MPMFKLKTAAHTNPTTVQVEPASDKGIATVTVEDQTYGLDIHWDSPHGGWVREDQSGRIIPFYLWQEGNTVYLWMLGRAWRFERELPGARRQSSALGEQTVGDIKAPMPGNILKILVQAGDIVEANTSLLVMESMKMEMTISAPAKGKVVDILCDIGQLVEMNKVLIKMEAVDHEPVLSETH